MRWEKRAIIYIDKLCHEKWQDLAKLKISAARTLDLQSKKLSKTQAKYSSCEALLEQSAFNTNRNGILINAEKIFPELITDLLTAGHKIRFSAPGNSMYPTICNNDIVTVMPIKTASIAIGDIILYRHKSGVAAHRVVRIENKGDYQAHSRFSASSLPQRTRVCSAPKTEYHFHFFLRGDPATAFDDIVCTDQILGKIFSIERNGCFINPDCFRIRLNLLARIIASCLKKFLIRSKSSNPK